MVWIGGALLLYIAGFGPMARLEQDGWVSNGFFQFLYTPLGWILSKSPPWLAFPLLYYLLLCGVRMG